MNYIVRSCTSQYEFIVSAGTLTIGTVISFNNGEDGPFCGTILNITEDDHNSLYINSFESCCNCVQNETSLNLIFEPCSGGTVSIDIVTFCNNYLNLPNLGEVFEFEVRGTNEVFCGEHTGYDAENPDENLLPVGGPFLNCWECEPKDFPPRSANTETTVCVICCDCGASASTINQVVAPHPVWTDGYGASVTQLNMITLGGNGLNS